ncbi:hypothetical protein ACTWP5_04795 [Streptomyces sp. 4N509B]|uniref:hypothetical protein n=1 Tax=Streptomyces sp. 4N509B TaxID=3457413 RepID=UPI003FCF4A55
MSTGDGTRRWGRRPIGGVVALAVVTGAALTGYALGTGGGDGSGTVVEGDGWRGVLLESYHSSVTLPDGTSVDAESGVPDEADVERFEEALPPTEEYPHGPEGSEAEAIGLDEGYVRQYTEMSEVGGEGRHWLLVGALCEDFVEEPDEPELSAPDWTEEWVVVQDGGSCFWNASMDLATGEIVDFSFNGARGEATG